MTIIESKIVGKKSQETCEDAIVVANDFVAVIDGSTSKSHFQVKEGVSNGRFAAQLIYNILTVMSAHSSELVTRPVEDFCEDFRLKFLSIYKVLYPQIDFENHPEKRICASMVIYCRVRREIWMIGDCQAMVNGVLYENPKPYEERIAQRRADLILGGMQPADARHAIEPLLIQAMEEGQNKTYAVLDGFPVYMPGVKVIPVPLFADNIRNRSEIVLASDGYPFLRPTLAESEEMLRQQLESDPQNIKTFIATKGLVAGNASFDDRSYVRFII